MLEASLKLCFYNVPQYFEQLFLDLVQLRSGDAWGQLQELMSRERYKAELNCYNEKGLY